MLRSALISISFATTALNPGFAFADGHTVSVDQITDLEILSLPNGFLPDGISIADDGTIYMASFYNGMIVRGQTNGSEITQVLVEAVEGRPGWGMELNDAQTHLVVAGGFAGTARVYEASSGALVSELKIADSGIVNDVIVADDVAYFTNSSLPELYAVPLSPEGEIESFRTIPLSGDFQFDADAFANANGIVSADAETVIVNHSFLGKFYAVDIDSGVATEIDLGGEKVSSDGIALDGSTLIGSEPPENRIVVLELSSDGSSAEVLARYTTGIFEFPSLVAFDETHFYVVNAKLMTERSDDMPYEVVRFPRSQQ